MNRKKVKDYYYYYYFKFDSKDWGIWKNQYWSYKTIQLKTMILSKKIIEHFKAEVLQRNATYSYVLLLWLSWSLRVMVGDRRIKIICPSFVFQFMLSNHGMLGVWFFFFFHFKIWDNTSKKGKRGEKRIQKDN